MFVCFGVGKIEGTITEVLGEITVGARVPEMTLTTGETVVVMIGSTIERIDGTVGKDNSGFGGGIGTFRAFISSITVVVVGNGLGRECMISDNLSPHPCVFFGGGTGKDKQGWSFGSGFFNHVAKVSNSSTTFVSIDDEEVVAD